MDKLTLLKKLAAVGGLAGLGLSAQEAEGAGIETIARKLGIGLEEAAKIKQLAAQKLPTGALDENIRAIKQVSDFKRNPDLYKKLGSGVDYRAFETPQGNVLKEPKPLTEKDYNDMMSTSILSSEDLAPKTKHIEVNDKIYKVQPKLDMVSRRPPTNLESNELTAIEERLEKLLRNGNLTPEEEQAMINRINQINEGRYQNITPEDIKNLYNEIPEEYLLNNHAQQELNSFDEAKAFPEVLTAVAAQHYVDDSPIGKMVTSRDIHEFNVGIDPQTKAVQVFDTSRFGPVRTEKLTPDVRKKIIEDYIAKPDQRKLLKDVLENPGEIIKNVENTAPLKKAAGFAAVPTATSLSPFDSKNLDEIKNAYTSIRKPVLETTGKIGRKIAEVTNPGKDIMSDEQKEDLGKVGEMLGQAAFDPANLATGGAGLALGAADLGLLKDEPQETVYPKLNGMMRKP